jgi:iron transport multicopper oxidase
MRWFRIVSVVVGIALSLSLALAAQAGASGIGNAGDDLRTGWYPDESTLTPQLVAGGTFGQLWSAPVNGQVYAQPLLSNGTLVVATENDDVYGLDPGTGAQQWSDDLGTPFNPNDIGCGDILPSIGTTATPVIDPTTNTVYLTYKTYVSGSSGPAVWYMDALDVSTGAVRPGFPVELSGIAQNEPDATFIATNQQQRPGLLLMNGVVYAAFGSHCDYETWQGWVFGVSTAGQVTSRWVDNAPNSGGAGIWQSGVGLMSDEPGSLFFVTGNGGSPSTPTPGDEPPATFGESVVHLEVQPDGTLEPVDFFAPFDAPTLDLYDADFGSGGIVGLPPAYFGTPTIPNLGVVVGKGGYVYLLNLDDLGGYDQGSGGSDDVVDRVGPRGGVWGRAGIWPGDGGYIYIPTSSDANGGGNLDVYKYGVSGTGQPSLSLVATSSDVFGWGSGPPVITSDGTTSGSALVWVIWSANRSGAGGQLRAYDPVPVDGQPVLVYSAPIGDATNYSVPGVGDGRLYVGTRDGSVIAFGAPVSQALTGPAVTLPPTSIGSTSDGTLTLTAQTSVTLQSLSSNSAEFTLGTPSQTLPATLTAGQTISVPVTFAPSETGIVGGEVEATLGDGSTASFALSGTGRTADAQLAATPPVVSLGGTSVGGGAINGTATFSNIGGAPLTITAVYLPLDPFSASGVPAVGDTIDPGDSININVAFNASQTGSFASSIGLDTTGGDQSVGISASAGVPGNLEIAPESADFGQATIGTTATRSFTVANTGGTDVTITKSKPPVGGAFAAITSLPEGDTIAPGASVVEQVTFTPTAVGETSGTWAINGDDSSGLHDVQFTGSGVSPVTGPISQPPVPSVPATIASTTPPAASTATNEPAETLLATRVLPSVETTASIGGLRISYTATAAGTTRFTLQRRVAGRLVGRACVLATHADRHHRACVEYLTVATFAHSDAAGVNGFRLRDYVSASELTPGTYRIRAIPGSAGGGGPAVYVSFRVTRRRG